MVSSYIKSLKDKKDTALLVAGMKKGDQESFTVFVNRYSIAVRLQLYGYGLNYDDTEDILQETLLRACQNIAQYRGEAALLTWLYRITANTFGMKWNRPQKRHSRILPPGDARDLALAFSYSPDMSPEEYVLYNDLLERADRAIDRMPQHYQELFELSCIGFSGNEVSEMCQITHKTFKSRKRRSRIFLAQQLEMNYEYDKRIEAKTANIPNSPTATVMEEQEMDETRKTILKVWEQHLKEIIIPASGGRQVCFRLLLGPALLFKGTDKHKTALAFSGTCKKNGKLLVVKKFVARGSKGTITLYLWEPGISEMSESLRQQIIQASLKIYPQLRGKDSIPKTPPPEPPPPNPEQPAQGQQMLTPRPTNGNDFLQLIAPEGIARFMEKAPEALADALLKLSEQTTGNTKLGEITWARLRKAVTAGTKHQQQSLLMELAAIKAVHGVALPHETEQSKEES